MCDKCVIGYWVPEKKRQKFNWNEFEDVCESEGFQLKMVSESTFPSDTSIFIRTKLGEIWCAYKIGYVRLMSISIII